MDNQTRKLLAKYKYMRLNQGESHFSNREVRDYYFEETGKKLDERTIKKAISDAFKLKLLEVRETDSQFNFKIKRDKKLEKELKVHLKKEFPKNYKLSNIIVINSDDDGKDISDFTSEEIHTALGLELAKTVNDGGYLSDNKNIGISGGRGPYQFARFCGLEDEYLRWKNIKLFSMTGHIYCQTMEVGTGRKLLIDSDHNTQTLNYCFKEGAEQFLIQGSIARDENEIDDARESTWLRSFDTYRPQLAFIGTGILKSPHRFVQFCNDYYESDMPLRYQEKMDLEVRNILAPIQEDLKKLIELISQMKQCPVFDICTNLYLLSDQLLDINLSFSDRNNIKQLCESINKKLLTVRPEQLKQIDQVCLIAGGHEKSEAIWSTMGKIDIHTLCTSADVAKKMLDFGK